MNVVTARAASPLWTWLQLLRIPNVFTAVADVSMGYLVADGGAHRPGLWLILVIVSASLYLAGIVLNDYFDLEQDRRERPERPLPSGRIAPRRAAQVGATFLAVGVLLGGAASLMSDTAVPAQFSPGPIALALAICILFYDALFKDTAWGPVFMGGCRFLNVMLGIGVTQQAALFETAAPWMAAGGIGIYVMGITWFARHEATISPRSVLVAGSALMLTGVALLALLTGPGGLPPGFQRVTFTRPWVWPMMLGLLTAPVWRRSLVALHRPQPEHVRATVKQAILSLIVLDAAVVLIVAGPIYALAIFALAFPATLLGRVISVT